MNVFGLNPVVVFGTDEQRRRMLPPIVDGRDKSCFAVTEPNTGLNTTQLKTRAVRQGDKYIVNGQKVWISTAQVANKILLLARTTPLEEVKKPTHGLSLFYTDFDKKRVAVHEIEKMGRKAVDSNELFFENFEIPVEDRIGEEGRGFEYILHGMNPERILIAAEAVGLGKIALKRATDYAKSRIVFNRPIGKNQAIQHPLAKNWMELEAAWLMVMSAGWQYDQGLPCGPAANAAKYLAGEAGFQACEQAVMTHGGFGYAKEYHVERYLAGIPDPAHRPDQPAAHSQLHCREGAGPAEVVLMMIGHSLNSSFRGDAKREPRNAQLAHRRILRFRVSSLRGAPRNDEIERKSYCHELHHRRWPHGLRQARGLFLARPDEQGRAAGDCRRRAEAQRDRRRALRLLDGRRRTSCWRPCSPSISASSRPTPTPCRSAAPPGSP